MLPQKVLINVGIDPFAGANENDGALLAIATHHTQDHLLQSSLRFGQDVDAGVLVSRREVRQVAAVAAVDSHLPSEDFFIGKILDLMRLAGLQLVDEFLAPLLPRFLGVWYQMQPLDDQAALQSQVLFKQVPHGPWVHLMMPFQLSDASLRIFSHGRLDCGDGGGSPNRSLTSAPRQWREVLTVILQLFNFKNQAPTDLQFITNLAVLLARVELLTDKLAAGVIHGD
jgi:hypothetical protein